MSSENRTPLRSRSVPPNDLQALSSALAPAFEILRPFNCAITFASVLLGGWLGVHAIPRPLFIAALSASSIAAGGNALNDLCGTEEDRINKPHRPLPSGRLPVWTAWGEAIFFPGVGLGCGLWLPGLTFAIALGAVFGLVFYNVWLKRVPLLGNLVVSLLGGLAFVYGGAAVWAPVPALTPAFYAVLFHLGREVLKDLEDVTGDRLRSGGTLPLRWGRRWVCILISLIYLLLILSTPLPGLLGPYGPRYLFLVLVLDLLLIYAVAQLWRARTPEALRRLSGLLKIGMLLGLCAFFLDTL